ncbi:TPA: restriction endonuclease subunit S [Vibrio parahaemolyticus]|nr:restriction endonuclease subunit S [Vibrio parahaemolyticus]
MRSHYKKLGQFISKVDKRNKNLEVDNLKGLSMTKEFRASTSNIVGTDMSKYKIVEQWQFACDFMSVIRVHAFPVVLNFSAEPVLVSPAYPVFEVINTEVLDPEYLMMWFRRVEFDRYADFKCDSAIRGGFGWEELCDVELPVPSIEKQREIVREYNVVNDRIALNEQLTKKLEDTAQAIYKQWFVDFEFPISKEYAESIGKPELEGKPFNSSGCEMEFNALLETEIPKALNVTPIGELVKLTQGQVINATTNHLISNTGIPLLRIQDLKSGEECIFMSPDVPKTKIASPEDIIVTRTGLVGLTFRGRTGVVHNNCFMVKSVSNDLMSDYLYHYLRSNMISRKMEEMASGSVQPDLSHSKFKLLPMVLPSLDLQAELCSFLNKIENAVNINSAQNKALEKLKVIILAKMSKA